IFIKVLRATSAYSSFFVALYNPANPIDAKQSEKILYGCTSGLPLLSSEKYQLPSISLPCFSKNAAPCSANSSQAGSSCTLSYNIDSIHTCLPCSHINLSLSNTSPV